MHKQQIELTDLKNRIFIAKRQLECVYNSEQIQLKEDEIKGLRWELRELELEKEGHLNVHNRQSKALKVVRNEEEYGEKMNAMVAECTRLRKESKQLLEKIGVGERLLMKTHDTYVSKHEAIRELEQKLALNKEKAKSKRQGQGQTEQQHSITEEIILNLEEEVRRLEGERKEGERAWQEKIKAVDVELILKRGEEEKRLLILRERERELKLNELKIR